MIRPLLKLAVPILLSVGSLAQDMIGTTFIGDVYLIDSITGESTYVNNCGYTFVGSLARSQAGDVYAVSRPGNLNNQLIRIDGYGNGILVGPLNITPLVQSLAYDDVSEQLFALTATELYKIDPATGTAGLIGSTPFTLPSAATFEPGGSFYVWEGSSAPGARGLYEVDPNSGATVQLSTSLTVMQWISHDTNGILLGGGGVESVWVIDSNGNPRFDSHHTAPDIANAVFTRDRDDFTQACSGSSGTSGTCTDCPCGNNAPLLRMNGCRHSQGDGARLLPRGTPSISAGDLRFELSGAKSNSFGLLLSGASIAPTNPANPCFGDNSGIQSPTLDGIRCAVQDLRRHGTRPIDSNGRTGFSNNGWGPPSAPLAGIAAEFGFTNGQTRHFQLFYRDVDHGACTLGANTTQVVTVTFTP